MLLFSNYNPGINISVHDVVQYQLILISGSSLAILPYCAIAPDFNRKLVKGESCNENNVIPGYIVNPVNNAVPAHPGPCL
jgi:hypothetical protein